MIRLVDNPLSNMIRYEIDQLCGWSILWQNPYCDNPLRDDPLNNAMALWLAEKKCDEVILNCI